jgi:hypothetical protein
MRRTARLPKSNVRVPAIPDHQIEPFLRPRANAICAPGDTFTTLAPHSSPDPPESRRSSDLWITYVINERTERSRSAVHIVTR